MSKKPSVRKLISKARSEKAEALRLWEVDHPYYCNQGNYFAPPGECGAKYKSWGDFLDEMGTSDKDMNLAFRWDWTECEDCDCDRKFKDETPSCEAGAACNTRRCAADANYRGGTLLVFWMGQRKGLYQWSEVSVCRADESLVRAWLQERLDHLMKLWAPLVPGKGGAQ